MHMRTSVPLHLTPILMLEQILKWIHPCMLQGICRFGEEAAEKPYTRWLAVSSRIADRRYRVRIISAQVVTENTVPIRHG